MLRRRVFTCGDEDEDTDEMDMDNEFLPMPTKEKKSYEVDHDSLGQQAVEKLIAREVDHICGIFGVDVSYP
jgi:ariadne-1